MTTVIGDGFEGEGAREAAGSSTRRAARARPRWPSRLGAGLGTEVAANAERWPLWAPVAFGGGAAGYFGLPREPLLLPVLIAAAGALWLCALAWNFGRRRSLAIAAALLAFAAGGVAAGAVKTRLAAAPVAPTQRRPVTIEAWVVDVASADASRQRVLLAPARISGLPWRDTPVRVRVTLREGAPPGPGSAVRLLAILNPPPSPAAPGAYDFARDAWFAQVGGSGLALRMPEATSLARAPVALRWEMAVNAARWSVARRLVDRMGPRTGGLAAALVTGHQAWLRPEDVSAMRDAGLAHILSISGVHMAIVGGFVFALVRLLIAAWPWAALRVPGKKVAAAAGFVAVCGYCLLAGAPPPAIRSALTAGIAFLAVLTDRRALSLHSLAVAALAVLAVEPEAICQPGFQMSFAATTALLALAERWPRRLAEISVPWPIRAVQRGADWLVAGLVVSLCAGLATDPFAIQHFNRIVLWSVPANLLADVLSSLVVMPALALGAALELAGVGGPPLAVAGAGLDGLTATARLFAGLPHAVVGWPSAPAAALPLSFVGLLILCLWRGRLRWLGLPLFAAVWLWPRPPAPIAWIAGGGGNAAVAADGAAVRQRPTGQTFAYELWARRRGLRLPGEAEQRAADRLFDCGRDACTPKLGAAPAIALWRRYKAPAAAELERLCASARVVILRTGEAAAGACPGVRVVGAAELARGGAGEVFRDAGGGLRIAWAQDARGERPWTAPAPSGDQ